jgi:EF-P beta-lysylation protein EpmB
MRKHDFTDPLLRQVVPDKRESTVVEGYSPDPLLEANACRVPGVLKKYAGRVLATVVSQCMVNCRFCFRRGLRFSPGFSAFFLDAMATLVEGDQSITEVVLSGGEPLLLNDKAIKKILARCESIEHVRRVRIHTRAPVVIPSRITNGLCHVLEETRLRIVVSIQVNHAAEIDDVVCEAASRLRSAGAVLVNQSVLLRGVNDSVEAMCQLNERLADAGVLPYYLHLLDRVEGAAHFEVDDGVTGELLREMRCRLPGYLIPRVVREMPGAPYKVPLVCSYDEGTPLEAEDAR